MAGPLSSEEIEDVVSSVRRLVSNEHSSRRLSRDLGPDKLLLTPALRVVSETSPLAPLILDAQLDEAPAADPVAADATPVDLIEAEWEDELWTAPEVVTLGEVALAADEAEVLLPPAEDVESRVAVPLSEDLSHPQAETRADWVEAETDWAEAAPIPFMHLQRQADDIAAPASSGSVGAADDAPAAEVAPQPDRDDVRRTEDAQPEEDSAAPSQVDHVEAAAFGAAALPEQDPLPQRLASHLRCWMKRRCRKSCAR